MRHKMNVRETLRLAGQIRGRTRAIAPEHLLFARWEVLLDALHLDRRFRQRRKIIVGSDGIAEKEKVARAFAVCSVRGLQYSERAGARDGGILDPVVLLRLVFRFASGARDQQRFEIQAVEGAIGDDEDFPVFCVLRRNVFRQKIFRRLDQDAIKRGAIVAGG